MSLLDIFFLEGHLIILLYNSISLSTITLLIAEPNYYLAKEGRSYNKINPLTYLIIFFLNIVYIGFYNIYIY